MRRLLLCGWLAAGCATSDAPLLEIGRGYRGLEQVNAAYHWAPTLCAAGIPAPVLVSGSPDDESHGRKLYRLFAKQAQAYGGGRLQPPDQVLVKESWEPAPATAEEEVRLREQWQPEGFARRGGRHYKPGKPAALFVMRRAEGPETDEGWTYAVLSPDGSTVHEAGRLASCMDCHRRAGPSRMFGLPRQSR